MKIEKIGTNDVFYLSKRANRKSILPRRISSFLSTDDVDFNGTANCAIGEGGMMRVGMDLSAVAGIIKISKKLKATSDIFE
ncbi:MAG: hypothetical protein LBE98_01820 [Puniceicoccales bacterium]|jgi:hypothetical protein|nr:hypothetical protein [Puniceicoccales bacterium]